ncbi:MAG: tryptophan--tRNA ligase [Alphaproteobacteria bacterium]|nr:tryptophan--tRNA ligase [Alphaproteobacteria bacterium]
MTPVKRILSGIRPTGHIHLGNYLGAIRHWVRLASQSPLGQQDQLFCIVDQHALTTMQDAQNLADNTRTIAAAYIASGIDPSKSSIFVQSHVPGHTELAWYLGCITPLGWLNRMTQFKDKAGKNQESALFGLYAYPVLMAADILIYKATHVPVGADQKQHVELARDIAGAFNNYCQKEVLVMPEPVIETKVARIMSLRDGTKKMSKSEISDYSRIHLLDDPDTIVQKIRKAKTDAFPVPETLEDMDVRPEAKNLMTIYAALTEQNTDDLCQKFGGQSFSVFKQKLSDMLIETLLPIQTHVRSLLRDKGALDSVLQQGAAVANDLANQNLDDIRDALGMVKRG